MNTTTACLGCFDRILNDQAPICDGSGVIAISDIPASRVVVCPAWLEDDEPIGYFEPVSALGYDVIPATMQKRIRDNVMAEIAEMQDAEVREAKGFARGLLIAMAVCIPVWIGFGALLWWAAS